MEKQTFFTPTSNHFHLDQLIPFQQCQPLPHRKKKGKSFIYLQCQVGEHRREGRANQCPCQTCLYLPGLNFWEEIGEEARPQ